MRISDWSSDVCSSDLRAQIDGIDREIQSLIAERALFAHQVGPAKGKLAAAVEYYCPEREAQVLRRVVDRHDGPLPIGKASCWERVCLFVLITVVAGSLKNNNHK